MTIGIRLFTYFNGTQVGADAAGNRYFIERRARANGAPLRRWAIYAGAAAADSCPAGWRAWLDYPATHVACGGTSG